MGGCRGGEERFIFKVHSGEQGPNLDWQQTADFPTTSALCLFRADACREIKKVRGG